MLRKLTKPLLHLKRRKAIPLKKHEKPESETSRLRVTGLIEGIDEEENQRFEA